LEKTTKLIVVSEIGGLVDIGRQTGRFCAEFFGIFKISSKFIFLGEICPTKPKSDVILWRR